MTAGGFAKLECGLGFQPKSDNWKHCDLGFETSKDKILAIRTHLDGPDLITCEGVSVVPLSPADLQLTDTVTLRQSVTRSSTAAPVRVASHGLL